MITGLRMMLLRVDEWMGANDGKRYRSEQWAITGGEVDPCWRRPSDGAGWEPSSRFTLHVVDGVVDVRLGSYGGVVWPTAWTKLFEVRGRDYGKTVVITDEGLLLRGAALDGTTDMHADARLS